MKIDNDKKNDEIEQKKILLLKSKNAIEELEVSRKLLKIEWTTYFAAWKSRI